MEKLRGGSLAEVSTEYTKPSDVIEGARREPYPTTRPIRLVVLWY
jgi:hypothetical protein